MLLEKQLLAGIRHLHQRGPDFRTFAWVASSIGNLKSSVAGIVHRDVKLAPCSKIQTLRCQRSRSCRSFGASQDHILLHSKRKLVLSGFALAAPLSEAAEATEPAGQPSTETLLPPVGPGPASLAASGTSSRLYPPFIDLQPPVQASVRSEQLATWLQRPRRGKNWNRELEGRLPTCADVWQSNSKGREADSHAN